jgi:tetratricopeptide (TPR) repeat protein
VSDPIDQEIRILRAIFWSERDPEGRAFVPLAEAYLRKGSPEEALSLLEDGLARHPDFASAHLVAARVQRALGRVEGVEAALASVLTLDPGNAPGLRMKGELAEGQGDREGALAAFREALKQDPRYEDLEGRIQRIEAGLPLEPFSLGAEGEAEDSAEETLDPEEPLGTVDGLESTAVSGGGDEPLQDLLVDSPLDAWQGDGGEGVQDREFVRDRREEAARASPADPFLPGDEPVDGAEEGAEALEDFFLEDIRPAAEESGEEEPEAPAEVRDPSDLMADPPAGEEGLPAEDAPSFEPGVFGVPAPDAELVAELVADLAGNEGAEPRDDTLVETPEDLLEDLLPEPDPEEASAEDAEPLPLAPEASREDRLDAPLDGLGFDLDDFPADDPDVGILLDDAVSDTGEGGGSRHDDGEGPRVAASWDSAGEEEAGDEAEDEGEASELASDLASLSFEPSVPPASAETGAEGEGRIGDDLAAHAALAAAASEPSPEEEPDGLPLTRTLGELYARQGLADEALHVFRRLVERSPDDAGLAARLRELEEGAADATAPETLEPELSPLDADPDALEAADETSVDHPTGETDPEAMVAEPAGFAEPDADAGRTEAEPHEPGDEQPGATGTGSDAGLPDAAAAETVSPPVEAQDDESPDALPARLARRPVRDYFQDLMTWASGAVSIDALAPGAPGPAPGAVSIDVLAPDAEGPPPPGAPSPLQPAPPPPDPIPPAPGSETGRSGMVVPASADRTPVDPAPSARGAVGDPSGGAGPAGVPEAGSEPPPPTPPQPTPQPSPSPTAPAAPAATPQAPAPAPPAPDDPSAGATPPRSPGRAPAEEAFEGLDDFQDWLRSLNR